MTSLTSLSLRIGGSEAPEIGRQLCQGLPQLPHLVSLHLFWTDNFNGANNWGAPSVMTFNESSSLLTLSQLTSLSFRGFKCPFPRLECPRLLDLTISDWARGSIFDPHRTKPFQDKLGSGI